MTTNRVSSSRFRSNKARSVKPASTLKLLLLVGFTFTLAGCGFHLRSFDIQSNAESFALDGNLNIAITPTLRRTLKQAGVSELSANEAVIVIALLNQRRDRRSVSTGGQVRSVEYETSYAVQYSIYDSNKVELLAPTWIERQRIYRIDRGNIVGSSEEQALLERELMQDIAGQIVRSVDAVSRQLQPGTEPAS